MKPRIKKKWLEALRSGKYEQGTGYLCDDGKYCCLGVLADTLKILTPDGNFVGRFEVDSDPCTLSSKARDRVGFSSLEQNKLIDMNDKDKATFLEIADYIEENL